jgi:hypothetical protein
VKILIFWDFQTGRHLLFHFRLKQNANSTIVGYKCRRIYLHDFDWDKYGLRTIYAAVVPLAAMVVSSHLGEEGSCWLIGWENVVNHSFLHKGTGKKYLATDIGLAIGVQKAASFGH